MSCESPLLDVLTLPCFFVLVGNIEDTYLKNADR